VPIERIAAEAVLVGIMAIPACLGVAILRYRLAAGPAGPVSMNNHD
jgi:hypothetical protein